MRGEIARLSAGIVHTFNEFTNLNWDINNLHKYPRRVNEIHSPVLLEGFKSIKGLGHTYKYSTSFIHSFQPQAKLVYASTEGQ